MTKKFVGVVAFVTLLSVAAAAQDAKTVISNAQKAMGAEGLNSITYSGTAADVNFLQSRGINMPMRPITNYVRAIDLTQPASRATGVTMNPPLLGGPAAAGAFNQNITAQQAVVTAAWAGQLELWITPWGFLKGAAANNPTVGTQKVGGKTYRVVTWVPTVKAPSGASYSVNGYINDQNMVERVETWLGNDMLGDMRIEASYSNYKDFGGVKVPMKIVQKRGDLPFFEVTATTARANPSDIATLLQAPAAGAGGQRGAPGGAPAGGAPPAGGQRGAAGGAPPAGGAPAGGQRGGAGAPAAGGAPPAGGRAGGGAGAPPAGGAGGQRGAAAAAPPAEKLADGVYRLTGGQGSYVSLAIDFKDHIVVLESGNNDARALAIIAEAKRVIPNKPIRYVVNTHPHSDHAGGMMAFVAEGATIVTHRNNKTFFENAYSTPRTLLTDSLAKNPKMPVVEGVAGKKILTDGNRIVEIYAMNNELGTDKTYVPHSDGMVIVFLPKEKILFQGDFTVTPGTAANAHVSQVLVPNLDLLKLDFEKYVPVHAGNPDVVLSKADVMASVGRK